MTNKILGIILVIALLALGAYYIFGNKPAEETEQEQAQNTQTPPPPPPPAPAGEEINVENSIAVFDTSAGTFEVTLDAEAAPKTVANFVKLAEEGYYNGIKFHRIVKGFMIQGGDPNSKDEDPENDGQGGPGYTVPAEIKLAHSRGAISMARLPDSINPTKASSGSQFFIVLEESADNHAALDGQYTAFGYVSSGMSNVTKIGDTPVEPNPYTGEVSIPLKEIVINKITIKEAK